MAQGTIRDRIGMEAGEIDSKKAGIRLQWALTAMGNAIGRLDDFTIGDLAHRLTRSRAEEVRKRLAVVRNRVESLFAILSAMDAPGKANLGDGIYERGIQEVQASDISVFLSSLTGMERVMGEFFALGDEGAAHGLRQLDAAKRLYFLAQVTKIRGRIAHVMEDDPNDVPMMGLATEKSEAVVSPKPWGSEI